MSDFLFREKKNHVVNINNLHTASDKKKATQRTAENLLTPHDDVQF